MPTIVCPQCNKDDFIQKVSAVIASGTSSGNFSGPSGGSFSIDGKSGNVSGYMSLSGVSSTELARNLVQPKEPREPYGPEGFGLWWVLLWIPAMYAIMIPAGILALPGMLIFDFADNLTPFTGGLVRLLGMILFLAGGAAGGVFGYRLVKSINNAKVKQNTPKYLAEKSRWEDKHNKWESAIQKWNRLYYCHRNGIVFDPETGKTCEPANIKSFIYEQS